MARTWVIVLAGGQGSRLHAVTQGADGIPVPKQFCALVGEETLLEATLRRAAALCAPSQTRIVVAQRHHRWWRPALRRMPRSIVVEPQNRGTTFGALLPLLYVLREDPDARVVLMPADHDVADSRPLSDSIECALCHLDRSDDIVLLGVAPEEPDVELGYIQPRADDRPPVQVRSFIEKPSEEVARRLAAAGALWNSCICVGRATSLVELIRRIHPEEVAALTSAVATTERPQQPAAALQRVYARLPRSDLSHDVIARSCNRMRVLEVPPCGWTDLGSPRRLAEAIARRRRAAAGPRAAIHLLASEGWERRWRGVRNSQG